MPLNLTDCLLDGFEEHIEYQSTHIRVSMGVFIKMINKGKDQPSGVVALLPIKFLPTS